MNNIILSGSGYHDAVRIECIDGRWRYEVNTRQSGSSSPPYYASRGDAVDDVKVYLIYEMMRGNPQARTILSRLDEALQPVQLSLFDAVNE